MIGEIKKQYDKLKIEYENFLGENLNMLSLDQLHLLLKKQKDAQYKTEKAIDYVKFL